MSEQSITETGVAVLAAESTDDTPLQVRGVALGEDDVTFGKSKRQIHWPRETLEPAAEALVGTKIVDDSAHDVPDGGESAGVPKQPPVDSIRGEVTDARYEPGVGVVFEGEVDDEQAAALVENGRVEVSPLLFHASEEDEESGVHRATDIAKWRDIALVPEGASEGATIGPADSDQAATAAAMSAEALSAVLDVSFEAEAASAAEDEESDETIGAATDDESESPVDPESDGTNSDSSNMDLSEDEENLIHQARAMDNPTVVNSDTEALARAAEEHGLDECDDPVVLESEDYEAETEALSEVDNMLTDQLVEQKDFRASQAAALSFEEKLEEFEDEEGEFNAEALAQEPKTGTVENEPDDEPEAEALSQANDLSRSVLTLPDIREMEAEGLSPREYIDREYDVDALEYETEQSLQSAINEGDN